MTFTYDATSALGLLRLRVGDTVANDGPRPGKANYSDAEIAALQGSAGALGGAANVCDALAAEWARHANQQAGPYRKDLGAIAAEYRAQAAEYRRQAAAAGEAGSGLGTLQAGVILDGGYADYTDLTDAV